MTFARLGRRASYYVRYLLIVLLFPVTEPAHARTVIAAGGADSKSPAIDKAIVDLVGLNGTICILATAADDAAEAGQAHARRFKALGLRPLVVDPEKDGDLALRKIERCAAIYLGGGSQTRLMRTLMPKGEGSPLLAQIRLALERGAVLVGNSAGAAVLSDPMIYTSQRSGEGLGVVPVALDQHFFARARFWRLHALMEKHGLPFGLGIDEATAVVFDASREGTVIGKGYVLLLENPSAKRGGEAVVVSLLAEGDRFNAATGEIVPSPERRPLRSRRSVQRVAVQGDMSARNAMLDLLLDLARADAKAAVGLDLPALTPADETMKAKRFLFRRTERTAILKGDDRFTILRLTLEQDQVSVDLPY